MRIPRSVLLVAGLAACRNDAATITNLAGTWAYQAPSLKSGSLECSMTSLTLIIEQTGASFVGSYAGGILTCGTSADSGFFGDVVSGTVAGPAVTFDFDNTDWINTGSLSGTTMTGQTIWTVGIGTSVYQLTGPWTATKN